MSQEAPEKEFEKETSFKQFQAALLFIEARNTPQPPDHTPTAGLADATVDSCQHEQNVGSTGKATVLEAASLEVCKKSQVCQPEILTLPGELQEAGEPAAAYPEEGAPGLCTPRTPHPMVVSFPKLLAPF